MLDLRLPSRLWYVLLWIAIVTVIVADYVLGVGWVAHYF
jgi:hypothetical protein